MVSLELAKKLKDAGLEWEPKKFDLYTAEFTNGSSGIFSVLYDGQNLESVTGTEFIWLPSLSQLLAEIEGRGYWWDVSHGLVDDGVNKYRLTTSKKHNTSIPLMIFNSETPEDAAASVLLWILEREKDESK